MNQGEGLYDSSFYWYTPPWGYVLAILTPLIDFLNIDVQGTIVHGLSGGGIQMATSVITDCAFNLVVKLPLITCDLLVGVVLYYMILKLNGDEHCATIAAGLWLLCPLSIWMSGVQAQFDSMAVLGMVSSIYCMITKRYFVAGAFITYAAITKMFPAILVPLMIVYVLYTEGSPRASIRNLELSAFGALTMMVIIFVPVMMSGDLQDSFLFLSNRIESVSVGESSLLSWNGIISAAPVIILLALYLAYRHSRCTVDWNRDFVMKSALTMCLFFIWPIFPAYPQYALYLLPMVILISAYGLDYRIPYILLSAIMTLSIILWTGPAVIYPLALYTDLLPEDVVAQAVSSFAEPMMDIYGAMESFKCLPAIALAVIVIGWDRIRNGLRSMQSRGAYR